MNGSVGKGGDLSTALDNAESDTVWVEALDEGAGDHVLSEFSIEGVVQLLTTRVACLGV